jgi:hypothetical protein
MRVTGLLRHKASAGAPAHRGWLTIKWYAQCDQGTSSGSFQSYEVTQQGQIIKRHSCVEVCSPAAVLSETPQGEVTEELLTQSDLIRPREAYTRQLLHIAAEACCVQRVLCAAQQWCAVGCAVCANKGHVYGKADQSGVLRV